MVDLYFEIKDSSNFIRIDVLGRERHNAKNGWDREWLKLTISAKSGPFNGSYAASMMVSDFVALHSGFLKLYNDLGNAMHFECLERYLEISAKGDAIGHFSAEIIARDNSYDAATLRFQLDFDQTFLPGIIQKLEQIITTYR